MSDSKQFKPEDGITIPEWIEALKAQGWTMVNSKTNSEGRITSAFFKKEGS